MTEVIEEVPVADLYVNCSLRVRNFGAPGFTMSDCCGDPATCAVETPRGSRMFRCEAHGDMVSLFPDEVRGPTYTTVLRKVENDLDF